MAQPYDYTLNLPSPVQGFLQGVQIGQAFKQQEAAKAQAQRGQERAQVFQQRVAQLRDNPSPAAIDALYFDFPEMKEQLDIFSARIGDADKRTYGDIARRAIIARQAGAGDAEVAKIYEEGKIAAQRAGRNDLVAQFDAAAKTAANPAGNDDLAARLLLKTFDPENYDVIYKQSEFTNFQKNLAAAGIDPNSDRGKKLAEDFVVLQTDPIVEMETPSGAKFVGPRSEYFARYGNDAPPPKEKAIPKIGEVRGGYRFNGGDPANSSNWTPVKGGGGSNVTGGFR